MVSRALNPLDEQNSFHGNPNLNFDGLSSLKTSKNQWTPPSMHIIR